ASRARGRPPPAPPPAPKGDRRWRGYEPRYGLAAKLARVWTRPAASRCQQRKHWHHRRERRAPAPHADRTGGDRRLLPDLPPRRERRRRRARRRDRDHYLRQDDRDRRLQRTHP